MSESTLKIIQEAVELDSQFESAKKEKNWELLESIYEGLRKLVRRFAASQKSSEIVAGPWLNAIVKSKNK